MMPYSHYILLSEDDDQYAFILQLAIKQAGIEYPVQLVTSRDEVINYMAGRGQYADRASFPLPATILLAMRFPLVEDFRDLRWIRQRPQFNHIPIVVLSGVEHERERQMAGEVGADGYDVKPAVFEDLVGLLERLRQRWLEPAEPQAAA